MRPRVVGFTTLKNAVSQGYPFLEAIYSFLHIGDKLYILDGNSTDGTEEILERLSENKRIKIFKQEWPSDNGSNKKGRVLGLMHESALNLVKTHEKYDNTYVFELQANEIIHEDCYKEFETYLHNLCRLRGYILPYKIMVGDRIIDFDWRIRLARLDKNISVHGDSTSLLIQKDVRLKWFISSIAALSYNYLRYKTIPMRFLRGYPNDILPIPLSKAIFRYGRIFPQNINQKLAGHTKVYSSMSDTFTREAKFTENILRRSNSTEKFYKLLAEKLSGDLNGNMVVKNPIKLSKSQHPKIMRDVLGLKNYVPRKSLISTISKAI